MVTEKFPVLMEISGTLWSNFSRVQKIKMKKVLPFRLNLFCRVTISVCRDYNSDNVTLPIGGKWVRATELKKMRLKWIDGYILRSKAYAMAHSVIRG